MFKSSLDVSGYNDQSSLVDVFSDYAQGVSIDNLNQFYEGELLVDLIDLEVDTSGEWIDNGAYFREVESGQYQRKITNTSGIWVSISSAMQVHIRKNYISVHPLVYLLSII